MEPKPGRIDKSQRGSFNISHDLATREELVDILYEMRFVPFRVESLFMYDSLEYSGYSPLFDSVEPEEVTPRYDLTVSRGEDDKMELVRVLRL